MRRTSRAATAVLALSLSIACAGGPEDDHPRADAASAARALVRADPAAWPERVDAFRAAAPTSDDPAAALIAALGDDPQGPGAACAVAVLGTLRGDAAITTLEAWLGRGGEVGVQAALALGRAQAQESVPALRAAMDSRELDAATRTAAAAALLDLGDDGRAIPFLAASMLAGTPAGAAEREVLGLPDKARWALERTIAIDAVARRTGGETFGLDPDASWPDLAAGVAAMRRALLEGGSP